MPGPRYVKDFEYPSNFGFTGSATDRTTVAVRPHERAKPQRFARGGKVRKEEGGLISKIKGLFGSDDTDKSKQVAQAPTPPPTQDLKRKGDTIQVPSKPNDPVDELKNQRARQMKELGLKRGGKVKHRGAKVRFGPNTDLAVASPQDPDNVTAPMAKRGGRIRRAMGGPVKAAKGGMRAIAKQEVSKHVNSPAPKGHKGLKGC